MKRLLIFLSLFIAVGSIQAVEVVLTDRDDQELARIDTALLGSPVVNDMIADQAEAKVAIMRYSEVIKRVVELAQNGYVLPSTLSLPELIDLILVSNYLGIRKLFNTSFIQLLQNKDAPQWLSEKKLERLNFILGYPLGVIFKNQDQTSNFRLINQLEIFPERELNNVWNVSISPDSSYYWVKFMDDGRVGRAVMYGRDGQQIRKLNDVLSIDIAPDSSYYWVQFFMDRSVMYGRDGQQIRELNNVLSVSIAPDSSYYWVKFRDGRVVMYGRDGQQIRELNNVLSVSISPDSSYYWVKFRDGRVVMYGRDGQQIRELNNIFAIDIAPDSSYYWVQFMDGRVVMYGRDGQQIRELNNVLSIDIAPDSSYYWVKFMDGRVVMYGRDGQQIRELNNVLSIDIAPDSSYYWVKFRDNRADRVVMYDGKNQKPSQLLLVRLINQKGNYHIDSDSFLYPIFMSLPEVVREKLIRENQVTIINTETG